MTFSRLRTKLPSARASTFDVVQGLEGGEACLLDMRCEAMPAAGLKLLRQARGEKAGMTLSLRLRLTGDTGVGSAEPGQLEFTAKEVQPGSLGIGCCGHQDTAKSWS
jgi:hypothetical protein